jgi:hypothetical protein
MQPYFFPYFEQFRLIAACDLWVVFDTVQYTRKSWMNRNRILNRDKGWAYISVPVRHTGLDTRVMDAELDEQQDWRGALLGKLRVYEREAPQYRGVRELIGDSISGPAPSLAALNARLLQSVMAYLGIATPAVMASSLDFDVPVDCAPGEWALHISRHLGATEYRNAAGGVALFDPALYAAQGIELSFHQHRDHVYATGSFEFLPGLSVIDALMWNDREQLRACLAE